MKRKVIVTRDDDVIVLYERPDKLGTLVLMMNDGCAFTRVELVYKEARQLMEFLRDWLKSQEEEL